MWVLHFDPTGHQEKRIGFAANGQISVGRNKYESTRKLEKQLLVLYRADGTVQNRFLFDDRENKYRSTNDPDTGAIKEQGFANQYIEII